MIYRIRLFALLSCIAISFIGSVGYSQEAFFWIHPLSDKINNGNLQTIFQDRQGFIWLGTTTGIYRFDGINYTPIPADDSLQNASFSAIFQAGDGTIWAGTRSGHIARINKGKLELFVPEEGNPKSPITAIAQDSHGNIWFSTYGEGVYCYSNNRLYNFNSDDGLSDNFTYTLSADKIGNIWVGTDGGISICSFIKGKKTVKLITSANGLPDNIVLKIDKVGSENMWIGMQDGGICKIDINSHLIDVPLPLRKWTYGPVNDLTVLGNQLWIGTDDHGIISVDLKSTAQVLTYPKLEGINYLKIIKLIGDREGNVWFMTNNALIQSPGAKLELLSAEKDKNFANIHSIFCDKSGDVWFSNDNGLFRYHRGITAKANPEQFLSLKAYQGMKIISLYQDRDGYIWIGTFGNGLLRLNPISHSLTSYSASDGLANGNVLSITGVNNEIWFATLGGASRCLLPLAGNSSNASLKFEEFGEASGLGNNFIYAVFADSKKRIWFATDGKGITVRENGKFRNYSDASGLKSKVVYSIAEDKTGHIWFSTSNAGLYEFDGKSFRNYSLKDGLSNLAITSLTTANSSMIFIVHSQGIDILDPATRKFSYLGLEEGINDINPDLNALSMDNASNLVWIGTPKGIIKLAADEYVKIDQPKIQLNKVLVFLKETDTLEHHVFAYNHNHFTFDFVGLWYKAPERVYYQVMLKGYDLGWITTRNTSVIYSSLEPGNYTFMVRASLNNDFSNASVKCYYFVISKPIWKTGWFITIVLLLMGIFVYRFIRNRETRLRREENLQKEKIIFQFETLKSQVNPHFLFNSFSTLSAIIDEDKELALDYVQKLSSFFRNILEYRDKTVITLYEELTLADTYYYLQKQRYGANFSLLIDIPDEFLTTFIPPMTLQMILENAVKHNIISTEKPLVVSIQVRNDFLVISNHIQTKKNLPSSTGIGLQNIENRYQLLIDKKVELKITPEIYTVLLPIIKSLSK
jgi:ligand-binding sensor domain-containing protein